MPKLPQIKPQPVIKLLMKQGFQKRSTKSSHFVMKHPDGRRTVVPFHNKPVPKGTLKAILSQSKIPLDEFLELIKN